MTQAERVAKFVDCCGYAGLAVDGGNVLARIDVMFDSNVIAPMLLRVPVGPPGRRRFISSRLGGINHASHAAWRRSDSL